MRWDGKDCEGRRIAFVAPAPMRGRLLLTDFGTAMSVERQSSPRGEAPDGRQYATARRSGYGWQVFHVVGAGHVEHGLVYMSKDDAIESMVNYAVSQLDPEEDMPDVSRDVVLQANSVGVTAAMMPEGPGVRVMMTSSTSEGVVAFDMYPSQARRHALRILQSCELAEGRQGVNA